MSNSNININNVMVGWAFHSDADEHFKMVAEEIVRLEKLKESTNDTQKEKQEMASILHTVRTAIPLLSVHFAAFIEKEKDTNNYYEKTVIWLDTKIKAWGQVLNKRKDKNMLDKINEAMDEWLQASWIYFGQGNIVEESKTAKEEYEVFKIVLGLTKNKPTRRGGKKHKKKKVA